MATCLSSFPSTYPYSTLPYLIFPYLKVYAFDVKPTGGIFSSPAKGNRAIPVPCGLVDPECKVVEEKRGERGEREGRKRV